MAMEGNVALQRAWGQLASVLSGCEALWLVGGSVGLMLQGVELAADPRDLDIYADREDAVVLHQCLIQYASDEQADSETAIYRSLLSHYNMAGIEVELVGDFRIHTSEGIYAVELRSLLAKYACTADWDGQEIRIMPLAHELVFNMLRQRPDRYCPIAERMKQRWDMHEEALLCIVLQYAFSKEFFILLQQILPNVSLERINRDESGSQIYSRA